jgi:hypothetical protein
LGEGQGVRAFQAEIKQESQFMLSIGSDDHYRVEWAANESRRLGIRSECSNYLQQVSLWRNAWRPKRVRILLVAESHVAEMPGDNLVQVQLPKSIDQVEALPKGFCRLVYCLGYGEKEICEPRITKNNGTWQFWDMFAAIASRSVSAKSPRRRSSNLKDRLFWKINVLTLLREQGIWLEDASIIALYSPGGDRPKSIKKTIRDSFEKFVWPGVVKDKPDHVWVIGKGVGEALLGLPLIQEDHVISQPQDHDHVRYKRGIESLLKSLGDEKLTSSN